MTTLESDITTGEEYFSLAATDLASGEYGDVAFYDLVGSDLVSIVPLEELLLGAAVSF